MDPDTYDGKYVEGPDYIPVCHFEKVAYWNVWSKEEMATQLSMCLRGTTSTPLVILLVMLYLIMKGLSTPYLNDYVHQREKPHSDANFPIERSL